MLRSNRPKSKLFNNNNNENEHLLVTAFDDVATVADPIELLLDNNNNNNKFLDTKVVVISTTDTIDDKRYNHKKNNSLLFRIPIYVHRCLKGRFIVLAVTTVLLSVILLLSIIIALLMIHNKKRIIHEIMHIERHITNPYTKARIFNPIRYVQVRYLDPYPKCTNVRNYTISSSSSSSLNNNNNNNNNIGNYTTAYFINLNHDLKRLQLFYQRNHNWNIQRYSAYEWIVDDNNTYDGITPTIHKNTNNNTTDVGEVSNKQTRNKLLKQQQRKYIHDYPFVANAVRQKRYGDIGCFVSHLRIVQEKLLDIPNQEYIFIFEDDVQIIQDYNENNNENDNTIIPNVHHQQQELTIVAPSEADIIFLAPQYATKRIIVPWSDDDKKLKNVVVQQQASSSKSLLRQQQQQQNNLLSNNNELEMNWTVPPKNNNNIPIPVRVIGGSSGIGYIITRQGAMKLLHTIATTTYEPLDLSIFSYSTFHVYLPLNTYNIVVHMSKADESVRRDHNNGG